MGATVSSYRRGPCESEEVGSCVSGAQHCLWNVRRVSCWPPLVLCGFYSCCSSETRPELPPTVPFTFVKTRPCLGCLIFESLVMSPSVTEETESRRAAACLHCVRGHGKGDGWEAWIWPRFWAPGPACFTSANIRNPECPYRAGNRYQVAVAGRGVLSCGAWRSRHSFPSGV